ncbi:MAG: PilN domain-containing protein [Pseudomonadota bacterium]
MARINLLPWREAARKKKQKDFFTTAALSACLMGVIVFYAHLHIAGMIETQTARNTFLQEQIKVLDQKIEDIKKLEKDKESLLARMNVIQELQRSRPGIVRLFDEMVRTVPEGIYLTKLERKGDEITITGAAQSNARVSNFMRNLDESAWFDNPSLVVIDASKKTEQGGSMFTLTVRQVTMNQTQQVEKAGQQ